MTIKDIYTNEYLKLNEKQRAEYDQNSLNAYQECIDALQKFTKDRNSPIQDVVEFEETIRENIIIEALYANPEDAQKLVPVSRTKLANLVKLLLEKSYPETQLSDLYDHVNQNSGTTAVKEEQEDMLKYLRFVVKYKSINRPDPLINEQL